MLLGMVIRLYNRLSLYEAFGFDKDLCYNLHSEADIASSSSVHVMGNKQLSKRFILAQNTYIIKQIFNSCLTIYIII